MWLPRLLLNPQTIAGRQGTAAIRIGFSRPIRPGSLTSKTVRVVSEKQGRDVTSAFRFDYDPGKRTLTLCPVHPRFDFGTGNIVTITVYAGIEDSSGSVMGTPAAWSFTT